MWSRISNALKPREGNDGDSDHPDVQSPPDPFRADATTYYTHQTPPTPPPGTHSRTASREEDIILSLRTQLALQREMCAQFEIDLAARDELVEVLTTRLEASEKDNDKRKSIIRSWKKKAADLEKMCRYLEHEVENSHQESMERSIMDEASGEALRQLHRQISQLEREKKDVEAERNSLAQTVGDNEANKEAICRLHDQISQLEREKESVEAERNSLAQTVGDNEANGEALCRLRDQISQLEQEKKDVEAERNSLTQTVGDNEANREALCRLHDQISQLEREKEDIEAERNSLARMVGDNEANKEALCRLHDQISQLEREKRDVGAERDDFSSENVRLRTHIHQLQKDSAALEVTIVQLNKQVDQDKEDIDGLNIALESKQQELELIKRKHGVRAANTRPPVSGPLRRASSANVESKTKLSSRRLSVTSTTSEAEGKENAMARALQKRSRRPMVPA